MNADAIENIIGPKSSANSRDERVNSKAETSPNMQWMVSRKIASLILTYGGSALAITLVIANPGLSSKALHFVSALAQFARTHEFFSGAATASIAFVAFHFLSRKFWAASVDALNSRLTLLTEQLLEQQNQMVKLRELITNREPDAGQPKKTRSRTAK